MNDKKRIITIVLSAGMMLSGTTMSISGAYAQEAQPNAGAAVQEESADPTGKNANNESQTPAEEQDDEDDLLKQRFDMINLVDSEGGEVDAKFDSEASPYVTFEVTPADDYKFDGFSFAYEDGTPLTEEEVVNLTFTKAVNVTPHFDVIPDSITDKENKYEELIDIDTTPGGTITPSFDDQTGQAVFTATPSPGYVFDKFVATYDDGTEVSMDDVTNLKISKKVTVKSIFKVSSAENNEPSSSADNSENLKSKFDNSIVQEPSAGGKILLEFHSSGSPYINVTATADNGYTYKGLEITDTDGNAVSLDDFQAMKFEKTVKVKGLFEKNSNSEDSKVKDVNQNHKVHATAGGKTEQVYDPSTGQATIKATPEKGYELDYLRVTDANGKVKKVKNNFKFNPADNISVTAVFVIPIKGAKVTGLKDYRYTGKKITQKIKVKVNGKAATYKLKYDNRKKIGTRKLSIIGTGKYKGKLIRKFKILPANVKMKVRVKKRVLNIGVKNLRGGASSQIQWRRKGTKKWHIVNKKVYSKKFSHGRYEVRSRAVKGKLKGTWTKTKLVRV